MSGYTHMAAGAAFAFAALAKPDSIPAAVPCLAAAVLGAAIPDIDQSSRKITKRVSFLFVILLAAVLYADRALYVETFMHGSISYFVSEHFRLVLGLLLFVFLSFIGSLSRHRTFTHSVLALAAFSYSMFLINEPVYMWFLVGYASHLFLDLFNHMDVMLLWPLQHGWCLHLCSASGVFNTAACAFSALYVLYVFIVFYAFSIPSDISALVSRVFLGLFPYHI